MNRCSFLSALCVVVAAASVAAKADPVIYPDLGKPATYTPIYATQTGMLQGTFISSYAGGEDKVRMYDVTTNTMYGYVLDNRSSTKGEVYNFGQVNQGDLLSFEIWNSDDQRRVPGLVDSSDPAFSSDGQTHAYVNLVNNEYLYLNMEDLSFYDNGYTDYDYNDLIFGLNMQQAVSPTAVTPEPAGLALLGTGLLSGVGVLRRRLAR